MQFSSFAFEIGEKVHLDALSVGENYCAIFGDHFGDTVREVAAGLGEKTG